MGLRVAAIALIALIVNVLRWRRDMRRMGELAVSRGEIPPCYPAPAQRVSFLVAAWNEESAVESCIDAILGLHYPNLEIVLCAGGTDRTWQVASKFEDSRLILLAQAPLEGKQRSLQRCLEKATGGIIYLVDAGCVITDLAFARTVGPILSGKELAVTTAPCTPLRKQTEIPFVISQCACRVYTSLYQPVYCSGLLGANSAMRRSVLEQAGGFGSEVHTGVDYDLGKRLLRQGVRIRYEAAASLPIRFHTHVERYLGQQARWLRSTVIHGMRFGAYGEVASSIGTSLLGFSMLGVPCLTLILGCLPGTKRLHLEGFAVLWGLGFAIAFLSRLRYLRVAGLWLGIRVPARVVALVPVFLLIDFLAWSMPLFQYPWKPLRDRW